MKTKTMRAGSGAATLAMLCSTLFAAGAFAAEEATLFPIPDYAGDLSSRAALTGDWGGTRTAIAEDNGLQFVVNVQGFYQGVTDGGFDNNGDWEDNGSADYRLRFDSGKSGLWPGGFVELHAETYWGDSVNAFTGAVLPVNFNPALKGAAGNDTYLSHVVITQFLSERFAITAGKIDTSAGDVNDYAHGTGEHQFMNAAFNLNPVTYLTSPYSTLGAGFIYLAGAEKQHLFTMMVYDGDCTINDSCFDTVDEGRSTLAAALRLRTNFFGRKGHQWFGFLYGFGSNEYAGQDQDPRLILPDFLQPEGVEVEKEDSTWAFFYNFDQQLVSNRAGQDIGVFGRIGFADEDTSVIKEFYSIGLGGTGLLPGRTADSFGVGYYYMKFNDDRIELVLPGDEEEGFELFYEVAVTPWLEISANVQMIDGALRGADDAVISGFRGRILF